MSYRKSPLSMMLADGEVCCLTSDPEEAIEEARMAVYQYISDHKRHHLPLKMTDDEIRSMDVEVHILDSGSQIDLPYQQWVDDYYQEMQDDKKKEEEHEYKRFLELREKWEERFQLEEARQRAAQTKGEKS